MNHFPGKQLLFLLMAVFTITCVNAQGRLTATDSSLDYCYRKVLDAVVLKHGTHEKGNSSAKPVTDRISTARETAFHAGILWYVYEYSKDEKLRQMAEDVSAAAGNAALPAQGISCPDYLFYGLSTANRIMPDSPYRTVLKEAAASMCSFYDSVSGVIVSPLYRAQGCYTAVANLPDIELLFRVSRTAGHSGYRALALKHAYTFLSDHIRRDYTVYPVLACGRARPESRSLLTNSAFDAGSQASASYGFTMIFRETGVNDFLIAAEKTADEYIRRFSAGQIPLVIAGAEGSNHDVKAAAIMSAALLELSGFVADNNRKRIYIAQAKNMLKKLAGIAVQPRQIKQSLFLQADADSSSGQDVTSFYTADYYYLQALLRLKRLEEGKRIYEPL